MRQLALYGLNGVANTVISYLVFLAVTQLTDYRIAIVVGYVIGMLTSYALNSRVVFRGPGRPSRFIAVNLILLALNIAVTWTIVAGTGLAEELAQLFAICVVFLVGFALNRALVFDRRPRN